MSLAASHEDSKEAVASHQGLKRLVKGERKRSFTPDIEPSHSNQQGNKRPKTGLKLKIKLNGNVVSATASSAPANKKQLAILERIIPAARQAELDSFGLPESRLLPASQARWAIVRNAPYPVGQSPSAIEGASRVQQYDTNQQAQADLPPKADSPPSPYDAPVVSLHPMPVGCVVSQAQVIVADFKMGSMEQEQREASGAGHKHSLPNAGEDNHSILQLPAGAARVPISECRASSSHDTLEIVDPLPDKPRLKHQSEPAFVETDHVVKHSKESGPDAKKQTSAVEVSANQYNPQAPRQDYDALDAALAAADSRPQAIAMARPADGPSEAADSGIHVSSTILEQPEGLGQPEETARDMGTSVLPEAAGAEQDKPGRVGIVPEIPAQVEGMKLEQAERSDRPAKEEGEVDRTTELANGNTNRSSSTSGPSTSSSSSSSSTSTDSRSDSDSNRQRRGDKRQRSRSPSRSRSRSREAGEHSEGEYRNKRRRGSRRSPSRVRHRSRSWSRSGYREPARSHRPYLERDRKYERTRLEARRYSMERGVSRERSEVRQKPRDRLDRAETRDKGRAGDSREREALEGSRRSRLHGCKPQRDRSLSRLADPVKSVKEERRDFLVEAAPPLPDQPYPAKSALREAEASVAQAAVPVHKPIGFADAWNMLYGSAKEDWCRESQIDELHQAATNAKRSIETLSKATNGKHTFENLVALMRDSYLKYMQVGAIWEQMIRMPNANPNRTRAKLADEGGMFPQTMILMRQIATECRTCPANTEASKLLRCLAERLAAIIQMRIVHIQRAKVVQDRQILLGCKGAPPVDVHGRKMVTPDIPGETYQRPSPTDSNASNNTSEQVLHPVPSPQALPAKAAFTARQASGGPSAASVPASGPQGKAKLKRPAPERRSNPGNPLGDSTRLKAKKPMPAPTGPGRGDAWAVEPLPWEIPPKHFDSEMRSWSILGGFMNATACFKSQVHEMESLMQDSNDNVKEAAGMLGFLDLGLGLTSMGVVLQLSQSILDLVLKIQISGHDTKQECS